MKNRLKESLHDPKFWIQIFTFAFSVGTFFLVFRPYYQLMMERPAEITVDIIPSLGQIRQNTYYTQTRPVNRDIIVDFYVILWNKGIGPAENVTINLRGVPQSGWFDYHWSKVYIAGFTYQTPSSNASIRSLLPNQQTQIQYHVRFIPSEYDKLLKQGEEPKIIIEISSSSTPNQRFEYIVKLP